MKTGITETAGGDFVIVNPEAKAECYAAAPELLEALKNAVIDSEQNLTTRQRFERARYYKQAIAKAEGRE